MTDNAPVSPNADVQTNSDTNQPQSQNQSANPNDKQSEEPWRKVKHKYKAAGKEHEVDYDELIKRAEKAHGADERFRAAAEKEKDAISVKQRLEKLKNPTNEDWDDLIDLIGFEKAKKFADKLVWDQIQWEEMSPEKRDLIQAKFEADQAKSELQKLKERDEKVQRETQLNQSMSIIQKEIDSVLAEGKKQGLPVADIPEIQELIIDEMIAYLDYMQDAEKEGRRPAPPPSHEDVLRSIQKRFEERSGAYIKRLSADRLKQMLTPEQLQALRQAEIDQLYAPIPKTGPKQNTKDAFDPFERRETKKPARRMRTEDFFSRLDQTFGR